MDVLQAPCRWSLNGTIDVRGMMHSCQDQGSDPSHMTTGARNLTLGADSSPALPTACMEPRIMISGYVHTNSFKHSQDPAESVWATDLKVESKGSPWAPLDQHLQTHNLGSPCRFKNHLKLIQSVWEQDLWTKDNCIGSIDYWRVHLELRTK